MTPTILHLPDDVLLHSFGPLDAESLRALRLTCRGLTPTATEVLFSHVEVWPTTASGIKGSIVIANSAFNGLVRSVKFNTRSRVEVVQDRPKVLLDAHYGLELGFSLAAESVIRNVAKFENLKTVVLRFAPEHLVAADDKPKNQTAVFPNLPNGPLLPGDLLETESFRLPILSSLMQALTSGNHPASRLGELSLENFQGNSATVLRAMPNFALVLFRLSALSLQFGTKVPWDPKHYFLAERERSIIDVFFRSGLKTHILFPAQANLSSLQLDATGMQWGYRPFCDLRGVIFPRLKRLFLGNVTFALDWWLSWIVAHGGTLTSLSLRDCPIVIAGLVRDDNDLHRETEPPTIQDITGDPWLTERLAWSYETRWFQYLKRFKDELPELTDFGIKYGHEREISVNQYGILSPARYCTYVCDLDPPFQPFGRDEDDEDRSVWPGCPLGPPDYDKEDQEALEQLLHAVKTRLG